MGQVEVCRVVRAGGIHIEAVASPFAVGDGHGAPFAHSNSIAKKGRICASISGRLNTTANGWRRPLRRELTPIYQTLMAGTLAASP